MNNFLLFFLLVFCFGCQKQKDVIMIPSPTNPNLTYFGYTLVDVLFDAPNDNVIKKNYVDEVAPFTNIADLLVVEPTDNIKDRLALMANYDVKGLLHLNEIFFEIVGKINTKSGNDYALRTDYKERWDTFISVNELTTDPNNIAGFYLGEEPFWNSISAEEYKLASDYIKTTVPSIPIFLVEAYAAVDEMVVPSSTDWVGFDHYFIGDPLNDKTYQKELAVLKSKLNAEQKIMLILDAHYIKFAHGSSGISKMEMDAVAKSYYDLANSDPQIIGIIGYHWPSGFEFKSAIGARDLPEHVLEIHKKIGKAITGKE